MVHSLANELIAMDAEAEARYATRLAQRAGIIQKAQQEALTVTQRAARERDTRREEAIQTHDATMHLKKTSMVKEAEVQARDITGHATQRQHQAVEHIIKTIREDNP